ncbi:MAG: M48 family metallopeptidase [Thermoanaerobaculia bacterium]
MKHARFPIALVLVFVLSACGGSGGDFNLISIEEEWQLGRQLAADIERQLRMNTDPAVNSYVDGLGRRIVAQTSMGKMPWTFHVVQDPAINAFAIPGGHVYVHTGLIANADNASELAGVMAHEISHVVARHSTEQISRQYGLSILAGIALGQNPGAIQQIAAQIVAGGALARFSRQAEGEADRLGVGFMARAGYNPRGIVTMFQELLEHQKNRPSTVEQFFATHPLTQERIREVENQIKKLGNPSGANDEPEFQRIRARV